MLVYRTKCALYKTKPQQIEGEHVNKDNTSYYNVNVKNMTYDWFIATAKVCNYTQLK